MGQECRCDCHPWTKALKKVGPGKPDPRGGVRRRLKQQISDRVGVLLPSPTENPLEVHNTCPKCGAQQKPTDTFCRADGTRLGLGKQCLGCGAPGDPDDKFCWNCALEHGSKPPEPQAESPAEDPLIRIRRQAVEKGLLKETVVS